MKIEFPGLLRESLPSGNYRYRVRVRRNKAKRIRLTLTPDDEGFYEQYLAARAGEQPKTKRPLSETLTEASLGWLIALHLEDYQKQVDRGSRSIKTLNKKRYLLNPFMKYDDMQMSVPRKVLIGWRDEMADRPSQADAMIGAFKTMYDWAILRELVDENTARGIPTIAPKAKGATPWSLTDVQKFFAHHEEGTKAHTALQILIWTGCRIDDLTHLGRHNEKSINGIESIQFQPKKKGSAEVTLPLAPALRQATRAMKVQGRTYILGYGGKPYSSGDSMSAMFINWCREAGLEGRSAHGVRKAVGEILAEMGASQYEIMSVHGHNESKTSEVYTKSVSRFRLAQQAMEKLQNALDLEKGVPHH